MAKKYPEYPQNDYAGITPLAPPQILDVYECWVSGRDYSFVKLDSAATVAQWVAGLQLDRHDHVHIVLHSSDEYEVAS